MSAESRFETEFAAAVEASLGFLIRRGFEMHRQSSHLFHFDSPKTRVGADLEWRSVGLWLGPHPSTRPPATPFDGISIVWLPAFRGETIDILAQGGFQDEDGIRPAMANLAELLRRYGGPLLDGNYEEWDAISAFAKRETKKLLKLTP
jgi:hypothetical protein